MREENTMWAIINARIMSVAGPTIARGTLLMADGKIQQVGTEFPVPDQAKIMDARGRTVTPGIIEAHCHAGVHEEGLSWEGNDGNEATDPVTPEVRALDGANPQDKAFRFFREAGITTSQLTPGSANIIGGEQLVVKSRDVNIIEKMILRHPSGMKAALGENPKRVYGPEKLPSTRMGSAAVMRNWLERAREYRAKRQNTNQGMPKYDMKLEALLPVLERKIPLRIHCHRADDIATAVRIATEFDLDFTLEHVTQGFKVVEFLKKHAIRCALGPSMMSEAKEEMRDNGFLNAATLWRAGVPFCLTNDHPVIHGRNLPAVAGLLTRFGVPDEAALAAITLSAAEHIGVADSVGSLEPKKDADVVMWSGDPLDARTFADATWIDGSLVFQREEESR